jgi:cell division protein FtsZ
VEEDSFIAPAPAEPEQEEAGEAETLHAEPDPFAEAALANAARPERAGPRAEAAPQPSAPRREAAAEARPEPRRESREERREAPRAATPAPRQSLFAKVTGAARALAATQGSDSAARPQQPAAPRPMAARSASPAQPERPSAAPHQPVAGQPVAGQPASGQPAPAQPAAQPAGPAGANTAQQRLSGLDPAERIGHSQAEEDLLDIPAFLRRQAN